MQIRFKFEEYVEEIVVTVRANELLVGLPERKAKPSAEPKTLYQVFEEAGELEDAPPPPLEVKQKGRGRKKQSGLHRFDEWYAEYPRKTNRGQAEKAWQKLSPDDTLIETMLRAVKIQRTKPEWVKDGGQFIPHPGTWLNNKRWLDEDVVLEIQAASRFSDKPWGAFVETGSIYEVLNLMAMVGLDDRETIVERYEQGDVVELCDWLWGFKNGA